MHDGLLLPRVLRRAGYKTDIADITELASVRMYDSAAKVWQGLAKNATEGIATPGKIVPLSLILFLGQVVPALFCGFLLLLACFMVLIGGALGMDVHIAHPLTATVVCATLFTALVGSYLPRMLATVRFWAPAQLCAVASGGRAAFAVCAVVRTRPQALRQAGGVAATHVLERHRWPTRLSSPRAFTRVAFAASR